MSRPLTITGASSAPLTSTRDFAQAVDHQPDPSRRTFHGLNLGTHSGKIRRPRRGLLHATDVLMGLALRAAATAMLALLAPAEPPVEAARTAATFPPHLTGDAAAVEALLERVLPGSSSQFDISLSPRCAGVPTGTACCTLSDGATGKIKVTGTSASELTGGVGIYLREFVNMTIGWPRGGGSRIFTPPSWPRIGAPISRARTVPYSHVTQVCTHSCKC